MASVDDIVDFDVSHYEHAVNQSEFQLVRQSIVEGETGRYTLPAWVTIAREVSECLF